MNNNEIINKVISKYEGWKYERLPTEKFDTCCGITKKYSPEWEGWKILETNGNKITDEVRKLAIKYYDDVYMKKCKLELINNIALRYYLFSMTINTGCKPVIKALQRSLKKVCPSIVIDGLIGNQTLTCLEKYIKTYEIEMLLLEISHKLQLRYNNIIKRNTKKMIFCNGWTNRNFLSLMDAFIILQGKSV